VLRDCLCGEVLLARSLLRACEADLADLLREGQQALEVPIRGVISDGQHSIRKAVQAVLPDVPHQLCHFHSLREAAKPLYEADRHAQFGTEKASAWYSSHRTGYRTTHRHRSRNDPWLLLSSREPP
jgi:transposase-like protein